MEATTAMFLGAIIGAGSSIATMLIREHFQTKRDRVRIASELAIKEYDHDIEEAKGTPEGGLIPPLSAYLIYHANLLEELLKKEKINVDKIRELSKEKDRIANAFPGAPNSK